MEKLLYRWVRDKKNTKYKGFTLIELLIAMSIISLIAMTFFSFFSFGIKFNTKNDKDIKCLNIAQTEIENLREQIKYGESKTFNSSTEEIIKLNEPTSEYNIKLKEDGNDEYTLKIDLSSEGGLYTINVNVRPSDDYFSKRNVNLTTKVYGG